VYLISPGNSRHFIPDGPTLEALANWEEIEFLASWEELALFPPGRPIVSRVKGEKPWFVSVRGETDIYFIDAQGNRHRLMGQAAYKSINKQADVDLLVTWKELESFPPGEPIDHLPT
jgi:hypothetical protein